MNNAFCTPDRLCRTMRSLIEHDEGAYGFHLWKKVEGGKLVTKGVLYKSKRNSSRPIALNTCPWCEQRINWGAVSGAWSAEK